MTQPDDAVLWCLKMNVGDEQDDDLVPQFDGLDISALFVEQEGGNIDRNLRVHGGGIVLHRLLFKNPQNVQCG